MKLPDIDIEPYKVKTEIIRQTVAQVVKDFAMFGMDIYFSGNTDMAYNELFEQLIVQIERLIHTDSTRLQALLYQVDITENQIAKAGALHPDWSDVGVIAELVIHRELKKVLIRKYYKENPDKL